MTQINTPTGPYLAALTAAYLTNNPHQFMREWRAGLFTDEDVARFLRSRLEPKTPEDEA